MIKLVIGSSSKLRSLFFAVRLHGRDHLTLSPRNISESRPLLLVLTLLFTFQFNHLQHHDSSVVYILNAYDLSVHSSIGCTCKMYVRTSVVITFALQPSYTDKHIFFFTFVRFTNICECVSGIQVYISCI